jgi:hypothetical protein
MKKLFCIYSRNKLDFKKYAKSINYDDTINYNDIISKLIKNDINNIKPSVVVVNSYIRKKIQKSFSNEKSKCILYALKNLEKDTINSIKELILDFHSEEYEINLIILNPIKFKFNGENYTEVLNQFNNVKYIEI